MPANLLQIVETTTLDAEKISASTAHIHAVVLNKSKYIDVANFTKIHPADLELLFTEYDNEFFDGQIKKTLGTIPLQFGLSKRMTRSGGKTACYTDRTSSRRRYEISVSTAVLFESFDDDDHRPITASGIICRNRLDAQVLRTGAVVGSDRVNFPMFALLLGLDFRRRDHYLRRRLSLMAR